MADEKKPVFPAELVDKINQYCHLAIQRDLMTGKLNNDVIAKEMSAEQEKARAYKDAVTGLSELLNATVHGEITPILVKILKDQQESCLPLGKFTRKNKFFEAGCFTHDYGLHLNRISEGGPVVEFYVDYDQGMMMHTMTAEELISMSTIETPDYPTIPLMPEQYKKDLANAVDAALGRLKNDAVVRKYLENK